MSGARVTITPDERMRRLRNLHNIDVGETRMIYLCTSAIRSPKGFSDVEERLPENADGCSRVCNADGRTTDAAVLNIHSSESMPACMCIASQSCSVCTASASPCKKNVSNGSEDVTKKSSARVCRQFDFDQYKNRVETTITRLGPIFLPPLSHASVEFIPAAPKASAFLTEHWDYARYSSNGSLIQHPPIHPHHFQSVVAGMPPSDLEQLGPSTPLSAARALYGFSAPATRPPYT